MSAVVLAGGRSLRMGRDKRRIEVGGRTLLRRAIDCVAPLSDDVWVASRAERPVEAAAFDGQDVRLVFDSRGEGPLAGMEAALRHAAYEWLLVVPVDMPGLRSDVLLRLSAAIASGTNASAAVFRVDGATLPLPMLVHRRALPALTEQLDRGDYRVMHFLEAIDVVAVALESAEASDFARNANTPADLSGMDELSADPPEASA